MDRTCSLPHPNLPEILCGRQAIGPREHVGPCAAVCFMLWGDDVNEIVPEREVMQPNDYGLGDTPCAESHLTKPEIKCKRPEDHEGGNHAKRVTLEWELNKHGRIKRSAVVNGRIEDLELRYGGPAEIPPSDPVASAMMDEDMWDELERVADEKEREEVSEECARDADEGAWWRLPEKDRIEILIEVGLIPGIPKQPLSQALEAQLLRNAREDGKSEELRTAINQRLELTKGPQ